MLAIQMAESYFTWLKKQYDFRDVSHKKIEVNTPYVDSFGDGISFIVEKVDGGFLVTDQGHTIWNLEVHGISALRKNSIRNSLVRSLIQFDAACLSEKNAIYKIVPTQQHIGQAIHEMTQLILKVSNLSFTSKNTAKVIFHEEVHGYFKTHKKDYSFFPNFSITGKSTYSYKIDYLFMTTRGNKMVRVFQNLSSNSFESTIASWVDTHDFRKQQLDDDTTMVLLINHNNDSKKEIEYKRVLEQYNIGVLSFDNKDLLKRNLGVRA